jgi:hypothetical protein
MTILRKQTRRGYTHISNELLDADGLSYRAKGIAAMLLSKPDDWEIKIPYLARIGKEGEKAVRTALQELAAYGFLMRERIHEDGAVRTVTRIADYPAFANVGTIEQRINGYTPKADADSDIPISDRSGSSPSRKRQVRNGEVLVNTEKGTTVSKSNRQRRNYSDIPDDDDAHRRKQYTNY